MQDSPQPVMHVIFVYKAMADADNARHLASKRHISHAGTARMAVQNGLPDGLKQPIGQPAESKAVATARLVAKTFYTARGCNIETEAPWQHLWRLTAKNPAEMMGEKHFPGKAGMTSPFATECHCGNLEAVFDFINVGFIPVILNAFPARAVRLLSHIASHAHHQTGSHASKIQFKPTVDKIKTAS